MCGRGLSDMGGQGSMSFLSLIIIIDYSTMEHYGFRGADMLGNICLWTHTAHLGLLWNWKQVGLGGTHLINPTFHLDAMPLTMAHLETCAYTIGETLRWDMDIAPIFPSSSVIYVHILLWSHLRISPCTTHDSSWPLPVTGLTAFSSERSLALGRCHWQRLLVSGGC